MPSSEQTDRLAATLRGFGPLGLLAIAIIIAGATLNSAVAAVLVLAWARWSRTPWREIGYVRPKSWIGTLAFGLAFGAAFKLVMKAVVMPLLGADPVNRAYHYLAGNRAALAGMLLAVTVGAGFGEETFFRGYLFERLGKLFGTGSGAKTAIVAITSAVFALAHYSGQGVTGVEQAAITGLVFGAIFAATGRLWMPMFAHAAFDVTAVAMIYWDVESKVAHLVFK
ncbi:MAG TPA: CPBP family intramembrane glutamic endopeptidase [Myxococcales bacterium]|nr:CPBP family intramembrane glutamic endopeptidase [Myxococcales bacterium]